MDQPDHNDIHGRKNSNGSEASETTRDNTPSKSNEAQRPHDSDTSENMHRDQPLVESLRILEALLFASNDILTADRLKSIIPGQPDARKIRTMVDSINVQLQKQRHPFEIVEIGGGYRFRTISLYYQWIQQLFKEKASKKLSIQSLECLAIIAYKQPITKAEIEAIRGVISDGAMKTLLEKRLVTVSGRSEKAGRPLLYATTKEFLTYFGLNKLADLPRIDEFEALAKEKLGELSEAELKQSEAEKSDLQEIESVSNSETENQTSSPEASRIMEGGGHEAALTTEGDVQSPA